jgi:hypothetical protein
MVAFTPREIVDRREIDEIVDAHNKYRTKVATTYGVRALDPLAWSESLANAAQKYANETLAKHVIETGELKHSDELSSLGHGENLALYTAGFLSLTGFVDRWGREELFFVDSPGPDGVYDYPNVANGKIDPETGLAGVVGHYTQIVWRDTTLVGCGRVTTIDPDPSGQRRDILVARYFKRGNIIATPRVPVF